MTKEQLDKEYKKISTEMKEMWKKIEGLDIIKDRSEKLELTFKYKALLNKLTKLVMVKMNIGLKEEILKDV